MPDASLNQLSEKEQLQSELKKLAEQILNSVSALESAFYNTAVRRGRTARRAGPGQELNLVSAG